MWESRDLREYEAEMENEKRQETETWGRRQNKNNLVWPKEEQLISEGEN